eukprot:IDg2306t1
MQLRFILGFVNANSRYIPKYTKKAQPLYEEFKSATWTKFPDVDSEKLEAFNILIKAVLELEILTIQRIGSNSLDTDASNYQVECALFQTQAYGKKGR